MRAEVYNNTEFGKKYRKPILNHIIGGIPYKEIQDLIDQRLERAVKEQKHLILDGYPKNLEQCRLLDTFIQKNALESRVRFILLDVDKDTAANRILYRQTCEKCRKLYNEKLAPPKAPGVCDLCNGALIKRIDDDPIRTERRIREYKTNMQPVIEFYHRSDRLIILNANESPNLLLRKFRSFERRSKLFEIRSVIRLAVSALARIARMQPVPPTPS